MSRKGMSLGDSAVSISALDIFANAVGALALLLLLFAINVTELARPSTLKILTKRVPVSQVGAEYVSTLSAVGGVPPYAWGLRAGELPEGFTLDRERGEITGLPAPAVAGRSYPFEVEVTDSRKGRASARLEISVTSPKKAVGAPRQPLLLHTRGRLPDSRVGNSYALYLSASGGSGAYGWSVEGLPKDFTLSESTGLLSGTPREPGTYEMILRVEDKMEGAGGTGRGEAAASLRVVGSEGATTEEAALPAPQILTESIPPAIEGEQYEVTLASTGRAPLRWSAQNLPPGVRISERGVISGTPGRPLRATVTVGLTDARGMSAREKTLVLSVKPQPKSALERIGAQGLWGWLGYVVLIMAEFLFLFILRLRLSNKFVSLLKQHNVNFIKKADGTDALNGETQAVEAVKQHSKVMHRKYRQARVISYVVLALAVVLNTVVLMVVSQ